MLRNIGYILPVLCINALFSYAVELENFSAKVITKNIKTKSKLDEIIRPYTKARLNELVDSYVRNLDLRDLVKFPDNFSKDQTVKFGGFERLPLIHLELGLDERHAFGELMNVDSLIGYAYESARNRVQNREKPDIFLRVGNNENVWLSLPLTLGETVQFPLSKRHQHSTEFQSNRRHSQTKQNKFAKGTKKIFVAKYPHLLQGGELNGWYRVEKACRDAGWDLYQDGGFRALMTIKKRPISKILPQHMFKLPVVNLEGELLANSWEEFLYGRLASNQTRIIGMDGIIDEDVHRWNWKYYWIGDSYKRNCQDWTSSLTKDVANVLAFNYLGARVKRDVATCSTNLHLLCYSVCDEHDALI